MLQNGSFLLCCEGIWYFRKARFRSWVRRCSKRISGGSFLNGDSLEGEIGSYDWGIEYAAKHGIKPLSRIYHESDQEMGERE